MYESFYQLNADPFRLSPDPGFSFQHRTYRKAMTYMLHALQRAEGFIMITGQPGMGKTTLVSDLVSTLRSNQITIAKIVSAQLSANDLLDLVAYSYNLDPEGCSKAKVLFQIERFLKQEYQQGRRSLLIIDEAQGLDAEALEEVRLLTNVVVDQRQLLQVFLVGQEQLQDTVNKRSLEQLHQRLIAATHLEPLDTNDTSAYIKHRLRCVNWKGDPLISTEAYDQIQQYSHGIPRQINQICSRLFLHGSIEEKHRLGIADVRIVVDELQQELLLHMDNKYVYGTALELTDLSEETYEEEPDTSPLASKMVLPPTVALQGIDIAGQKLSKIIAATKLHLPDLARMISRPAVWGGVVTLIVMIAAKLVMPFINGDSDQFAYNQKVLTLDQAEIQQIVQTIIDDTTITSVHSRTGAPVFGEQTSSNIQNSEGEAGSKTWGQANIVATLDIETRQTSLPDVAIDEITEQHLDEPAPDQETASFDEQPQSSQAQKAESLEPVNTPVAVPLLSVGDEIEELLDLGFISLELNRLLIPKNNNAYHYFQKVLKLDPQNNKARSGIEQIVTRYATLATNALDTNDREKAKRYTARGLQIRPNNKDLLALHNRLNTSQFEPSINPAPAPEPENIFSRFKEFFTRPPDKSLEDQPQMYE
jgi:general secretion pathway protein A